MKNQWHWFIYIIECLDGSYYTGMTWDPEIRTEQHVSKLGAKYTAKHGFKKLVYLEEYDDFDEARSREKQIHGWTRVKKQKLINREWGKEEI